MGLPAPARLQPLASAEDDSATSVITLATSQAACPGTRFLGETPWQQRSCGRLPYSRRLFRRTPALQACAKRDQVFSRTFISFCSRQPAPSGHLCLRARRTGKKQPGRRGEEQKDASDSLFKWLDKLSDPTVGRAAWRAVTDSADREPRLEAQVLALAQDAVTELALQSLQREPSLRARHNAHRDPSQKVRNRPLKRQKRYWPNCQLVDRRLLFKSRTRSSQYANRRMGCACRCSRSRIQQMSY